MAKAAVEIFSSDTLSTDGLREEWGIDTGASDPPPPWVLGYTGRIKAVGTTQNASDPGYLATRVQVGIRGLAGRTLTIFDGSVGWGGSIAVPVDLPLNGTERVVARSWNVLASQRIHVLLWVEKE